MKVALLPLQLEIEDAPSLNNPLVRIYIDPDLKIEQEHINAIMGAIEYANGLLYDQ